MTGPTRILFVCVKNGGKSQLAAGLLAALAADDPTIVVESAGTHAGTALNAESVASLAELHIDISDQRPRQLTDAIIRSADLVVTVGGDAEVEALPGPSYETWDIDEPSRRGVTGADRMRLVRDDIDRHVRDLYRRLRSTTAEVTTVAQSSDPAH